MSTVAVASREAKGNGAARVGRRAVRTRSGRGKVAATIIRPGARPAAEPADVTDLLNAHGRAAIESHRRVVSESYYGGREAVVLKVATYRSGPGQYTPCEVADDVFMTVAVSALPNALETAVRRVFELARELDPSAVPGTALTTSVSDAECRGCEGDTGDNGPERDAAPCCRRQVRAG